MVWLASDGPLKIQCLFTSFPWESKLPLFLQSIDAEKVHARNDLGSRWEVGIDEYEDKGTAEARRRSIFLVAIPFLFRGRSA